MSSAAVQAWDLTLGQLLRNRYHRVPRDWAKEEQYLSELELLYEQLTEHERLSVRYPQPPVRPSLIAHDSGGHLIGFEECFCPPESTGS